MTQSPKKLEMLLMEGTPHGLRYMDLINWTGRVFVSPRASFKQLLVRPELNKAGIYFLIGKSSSSDLLKVYIGEADILKNRLIGHAQNDFWSEVVVVTAKDEGLDKASVRYAESVLVQRALLDKQCEVENGNQPALKNLSEANLAVMDEFIENTVFVLGVLGYKIIRSKYQPEEKSQPLLYFGLSSASATGRETDEGFIVYSGSTARVKETPSWEDVGKRLRKKLLENGVLKTTIDNPDVYVFTQDYVFNSPSAAAGMISGRSENGRIDWKTKEGKTLKQLQEEL